MLPCIQRLIRRERAVRWSLIFEARDRFCRRSAGITMIDFKAIGFKAVVVDPAVVEACDFTNKVFTRFARTK